MNLRPMKGMKGRLGGNVSYTVDGLVNGKAYRFKVMSVNINNLTANKWSEEVLYVPGAVIGLWAWILIIAGVVLFSTAGCFLYRWVKGANSSASKGVVGGGAEYERLGGSSPTISRDSFANSTDSLEEGLAGSALTSGISLDNDARLSKLMG